MNTSLFILLFISTQTLCSAQDRIVDNIPCETIFKMRDFDRENMVTRYEQLIDFADKKMNWQKLRDTLTFKDTSSVQNYDIEKTGYLRFVVRENGNVDCVTILKRIRTDIDLRAIEKLKLIKFTPALQNGNPTSTDGVSIYILRK